MCLAFVLPVRVPLKPLMHGVIGCFPADEGIIKNEGRRS